MDKQGQTQDKKTQIRRKPAEPAGVQLAAEPGLAVLNGFDQALASGDGRPSNQATHLADRRILPVQRAALAGQIGRQQGNHHLQILLSELGQPHGIAPSTQPAPAIQRQEHEESGDEPTPEQKAAAKAAARAAEAQAGQSAQQARQTTSQSKSEGNKEKQAGKTARQKVSQARSAAKAARSRGGKKKRALTGHKAAPAAGAPAAKGPAGPALEKAPASPEEDPAFQQVVGKAKQAGRQEKKHDPAGKKAKQAQDAVPVPAKEIEGRAQANQARVMEAAPTTGFNAAAFKAALMARIAAIAPRTTAEADNFKGSNKLSGVKSEMSAKAGQETAAAKQPMNSAAGQAPNTSAVPARPATALPPAAPGPGVNIPGAGGAAPKPKTTAEVEKPIQENTRSIDEQMQSADVTEEQLANSNEPEFKSALDAKQEAKTQAETGPQAFRQAEQGTLEQAQAEAQGLAQERTQAMHADRAGLFGQVAARQGSTITKDEQERQRVGAEINTIYEQTKSKVESILSALDGKVSATFEQGAAEAKQAFEDYVDARVEAYKERRYGGWFGWARWAKDKLLGMPSEVNVIYQRGRQLFIAKMDAVIDNVVAIIGAGLSEAKAEIANGKQRIQEFLAGLPEHLQEVGQQAAQEIQSKFEALESSVENKQNELIDTLANKYNETLSAVDARIEELKAANQGLVQKALNAVVGAIKTILKLKDMLLSVLAKAAGVVGKIIKDPIGFLGNLIKGISQGVKNFASRIKEHLISGLVGWLTGALGPLGIQIPENIFSLEGIFSLVVQVLGLSWEYIRAKAVKLLGEPVVQALEKGFEVFKILVEQGPIGLWEFLKDQFTDLKETVIDAIQDIIKSEVVEAGVEWIMGLLTPAGAFIKAAKAIYKIVMFFVEKGSQVMGLVNSVIDGVAAIAGGAVSGAASLIENALAKALPVVIGFLASLLGLDDLAEKVQGVIKKIRSRIEAAIDSLILKARKAFKGMGKALGFGEKEVQGVGSVTEQAEILLSTRLGAETTANSARRSIHEIYQQLQPKGLKKLELVPHVDDQGNETYSVIAEASPAKELLKLKSKIPAAKSSALVTAVSITLSEPVEKTMPIGVEDRAVGLPSQPEAGAINVPYVSEGKHGAYGTIESVDPKKGGKRKYASLPGETGYKGSLGALFIPEAGAKKVELMTWNAGKLDFKNCSNKTHGETQFISWFNKRPPEFRRSVTKIEMANKPYSPCAYCSILLADFLTSFKKYTGKDIEAKISWSKVYSVDVGCKELSTTNNGLEKLQSAGWILEGEWPAGGPPEKATEKKLEVLNE